MRWMALLVLPLLACGDPPAPAPAPDRFAAEVRPLMTRYCFGCHKPGEERVDLSAFETSASLWTARDSWIEAWQRLRTGAMPPSNRPQPTPPERDSLVRFLEDELGRTEPGGPRDPGRVVLRRLTRVEYHNTLRDLFGVAFPLRTELPADEVAYGFDNVGDVLSVPPLLMERHMAAAREVLGLAVVTPEEREPRVHRADARTLSDDSNHSNVSRGHKVLFSNGEVYTHLNAAAAGEFVIRVRACGDQAGPEAISMGVVVDGRMVETFTVAGGRNAPEDYEVRVRMEAGRRRVGASFLNDYYQPNHPDPDQRDRNLAIESIEVMGPFDSIPIDRDVAHRRIFVSDDPRAVIAAFLARAFRRSVTPAEIDRFLPLYELARSEGESFEAAMRVPLQAILVSPEFLFRIEADSGGVAPVRSHELASRLSYFLWSSMPDDALRAADLTNDAELERQARRMLADPRAVALAENFAVQWLQVRRLERATPDEQAFPEFDEGLRTAMRREIELFFESVLREGRSVLTLLDADYTFVNERLAAHYGIPGVRGAEMRRVALPDDTRGGVLTMAAVLTVTSTPMRTSPTQRGKWMLEAILGAPPPPPLPDAGSLPDHTPVDGLTLRRRLERHRDEPRCVSCHQLMDPLGFAFENYDALGRWREVDGGLPIDASAVLPGGREVNGPLELRRVLLDRRDEFVRCLVEKMMVYALGRGLDIADAPAVREIVERVRDADYRMSEVVLGIVESYPFRYRR